MAKQPQQASDLPLKRADPNSPIPLYYQIEADLRQLIETGVFVPDDVLLTSIWPGNANRGRTDLNVLIHRTRKSLMNAGVNPSAVLARARQGRATAFHLAPAAKVEVR